MRERRIIILFLVGVLLLPMMMGMLKPEPSMASEAEGGFTYIDSDGQITITGYDGINHSVLVPSEIHGKPVVGIGNKAFENAKIKDIFISEGIKSLGERAFYGCSDLERIILPDSLTSIGGQAFYKCIALKNLEIPKNVNTIGAGAFALCEGLTKISIPYGVTTIEFNTFTNCTSLGNINIPNSVTSIGSAVFQGCTSLESIELPDSINIMEGRIFYDCSILKEVILPKDLLEIPTATFSGCKSLRQISIPEGVEIIGDRAFKDCKDLTKIIIPGSVKTIGNDVFNSVNADFTIYGYKESFAEGYAGENGLPFRSLINEVSFDSRGGTPIEEISVEYDTTITAPPIPIKPGYQFLGWYRDMEGCYPWDFDSDIVTEDTLLYGKWASSYITAPSVQLKIGTTMDSPCTILRFIAGIHSIENLEKAGFVISLENTNPTIGEEDCTKYSTDTVYRSILAGGESVSGDSLGGEYILALTSQEIERDAYANEIHVRPFVLLEDGLVSYGDVGTFTVEGCIEGQGGEDR